MSSLHRLPTSLALAAAAALALGALAPAPCVAQSITAGAVGGVARTADGQRLPGVRVTLTHRATGVVRTVVTDAAGRYLRGALAPGRYDLRAERLGFRPLVVPDIVISPAGEVTLDLQLTAAEPPVTEIDTVPYVAGAIQSSLARGSWDQGRDLVDLADPQGRLGSLPTFASLSSGGLGMAGLPDRLSVVGVDGIARIGAAHPGSARTDLPALDVPFLTLDHAEIQPGTDVEWPGFGGGLISAFTARAPRGPLLRAYGDVAGGGYRGALIAGGPVVRDTASVLVGLDFRRIETGFAAPWGNDTLATAAVKVAHDSLGVDLSAYQRPVTERTDVLGAFGRFDWEVASGQSVALRAALADRTSSDLDLGAGHPVGLGSSLEARDISGSASFNSRFTTNLRAQLSLSLDRSVRDYRAPALPGTILAVDGLAAGSDGALPGRFERNATRAAAELLYRHGHHDVKLGIAATWTSHDITYSPWEMGSFLFGSVADFAAGRGAFVQTVGGVPAAQFSVNALAGLLQDAWSPMAGLDIQVGVRIERERWPTGAAALSTDWLRLTGLSNVTLPKPGALLNPRFAFAWAAGPQREWLLRGDAGLFAEGVDPSVLAEVLSHDGSVQVRRGVGALGAWPALPDSAAAPVMGPALTILNPGFRAPRTARAALTLARNLGGGASFQVMGQYRHTDYLPRRTDLNLAPVAVLRDEYGRPVYGTLEQMGSLLTATPGSNRRFSGFDVVSGIDPSGYSDYYGFTASFERVRSQGLSLWASYTYSRTSDNWPGALGAVPGMQLSPLPDSSGRSDWRDGRSDLDLPHRAMLGAEWTIGAVRVAVLGRYRSGLPFTPGFRDGVDANGDGTWGNDPAFVSDTVSGAAAVVAGSACLRGQIGRFAQRNSCRAPGVASVDARLVVRLFTVLGGPADLVVDGLNLVASNDGIVDRALYLVNPTRSVTTSAAGVVNVPLVANPHFGKILVRRSASSAVRAGIRINF